MKSETKHKIFMVIPLAAIVLFIVLIGLKQSFDTKWNDEMQVKCQAAGGEVIITRTGAHPSQTSTRLCVKVIKM